MQTKKHDAIIFDVYIYMIRDSKNKTIANIGILFSYTRNLLIRDLDNIY